MSRGGAGRSFWTRPAVPENRDDRGKVVSTWAEISPQTFNDLPKESKEILEPRETTFDAPSLIWLYVQFLAAWAIAAAGSLYLQSLGLTKTVSIIATWAVIIMFYGLYVVSFGRSFRLSNREFIRRCRGLLPVNTCPACLYNLSALEPESDGCTPCPECGHAWNAARWKADFSDINKEVLKEFPNPNVRTRVSDARGRTLAVAPGANALARSASRNFLLRRAVPISLGAFILMTCVLIAIEVRSAGFSMRTLKYALLSTLFATSCMSVLLAYMTHRAFASGVILGHMFRNRPCLCPVCDATLDTTPSVGDGALLCRRCGAAWPPDAG